EFSTESNFTTSGGYGPNQVSAILSIGALAGVLLALLDTRRRTALLCYGLAAGLLFQAVLTFSRGGVFAVLVCLAVLMAHYFWRPDIGLSYLIAVVLITVIAGGWLMPRLNSWTGGALAERYASLDTTHRSEIASEDVELFFDHPVAGVGVGLAKSKRKSARYLGIAPHTEFSRVLAEHGSFGVLALLALAAMTAARYVTAPSFLTKGWVCSLTVWCLATMSVSAMRLSILGVLFGIAYLPWQQLAPSKEARS
ncbi:MAG: O-antigen ligase family protein, partial [Acidobacteriota bacterium]